MTYTGARHQLLGRPCFLQLLVENTDFKFICFMGHYFNWLEKRQQGDIYSWAT